jgi:hypothetical protein
MKKRHQRWLIAVFATVALCLLAIAPGSAYAATGHAATTPVSTSTTGQIAAAPAGTQTPAAPAGTTVCSVTGTMENNSGWSAITGAAWFTGCAGNGPTPVVCHVQAVLQGQSGLTSGFTTLLDGPSEAGCTSATPSVASLPCSSPGAIGWTYRTEILASVHWSDGSTSTSATASNEISSDHQCDTLA